MSGPLNGIRVLDVSILVQGPQAGAMLSDMGADVIKIELPGFGDHARFLPLSAEDLRSPWYIGCNRGKRALTLDLHQPDGVSVFRKLAETADVVLSNFQTGNARWVGAGLRSPRRAQPRYRLGRRQHIGARRAGRQTQGCGSCRPGLWRADQYNRPRRRPAIAGGRDHRRPHRFPEPGSRHTGPRCTPRQQTGRGQRVEVSLLGGQIWAQASEYTAFFLNGKVPGRANFGHPLLVPTYSIFETADGWLALVGVAPDEMDAFCIAIDRPDLAVEEGLRPASATLEDMERLAGELKKDPQDPHHG